MNTAFFYLDYAHSEKCPASGYGTVNLTLTGLSFAISSEKHCKTFFIHVLFTTRFHSLFFHRLHVLKCVDPPLCVSLPDLPERLELVPALGEVLSVLAVLGGFHVGDGGDGQVVADGLDGKRKEHFDNLYSSALFLVSSVERLC